MSAEDAKQAVPNLGLDLVPGSTNFVAAEEQVAAEWRRANTFKVSQERNEGLPPFSFYDGPPFATGTPHYGHILTGVQKDIVTRFAHQMGRQCSVHIYMYVYMYVCMCGVCGCLLLVTHAIRAPFSICPPVGHSVERRFGWDTHGLPIEHLVDKELKISSVQGISGGQHAHAHINA
jgi:isoleucyl-tRNA synthetase